MNQKRVFRQLTAAIAIGLLATQPAAAETWTGDYRTIISVYPHSGGLTFNLSGPTVVQASPCPNRFVLTLGMTNYSVIVATLLSAHAQGKRVMINYEETSVSCDVPVNRFITES